MKQAGTFDATRWLAIATRDSATFVFAAAVIGRLAVDHNRPDLLSKSTNLRARRRRWNRPSARFRCGSRVVPAMAHPNGYHPQIEYLDVWS